MDSSLEASYYFLGTTAAVVRNRGQLLLAESVEPALVQPIHVRRKTANSKRLIRASAVCNLPSQSQFCCHFGHQLLTQ
jgi:hypothetical protein